MPTYITEPIGVAAYTDDGDTMYLEKREPSRSGNSRQTVDRWKGSTAAARAMYEQYTGNTLIDSISLSHLGAASVVTVVWKIELGQTDVPDEETEDDTDTWNVGFLEVPTPLVAHRYFQVAYLPASGEIIEDELARAESFIKRGKKYIASGDYKDWTKRYYGLRMAGVEEWTQYGLEITRTYRTSNQNEVKAIMATVGQVVAVANINMPAALLEVVNATTRIKDYAGGGDASDPDNVQFEANLFEFLHRPPQIQYDLDSDGNPVYDITETWWGIQEWSKVIYPGGGWDPQGATT